MTEHAAWDVLIAEADRRGYLRFCKNGIAVLNRDDAKKEKEQPASSSVAVVCPDREEGRPDNRPQQGTIL